ncbi:MAG TPA: LptF/LptG family permease [Gemmatimonas sp.]|nr:LptF/LptG family permease [Gemmatimonas sp.]
MTALANTRSACIGLYRAALYALPPVLREKHGAAMTASFADELARTESVAGVTATTFAATLDVTRRAGYERLRRPHDTLAPAIGASMYFRRLAGVFVIAFVTLTTVLLVQYGVRQSQSANAMRETIVLAVPFTAAMTIPMALFIATLWVSADVGTRNAPGAPADFRRLLRSVLVMSTGIAAFTLLLTAEIVPRTNARLANVLAGHEVARGDRSMTLGELRAAERAVHLAPAVLDTDRARDAQIREANFGVEIHKKYVLSAACIVLALIGLSLGSRFPRGGIPLAIVASVLVFGLYLVSLQAGEQLAEGLVVSPGVGMWGANILGLSLAALALLTSRREPRAVT